MPTGSVRTGSAQRGTARTGSSRYDPEVHGPRRVVGPGFAARVYALVARVPRGRVTTYGAIAAALGLRSAARHVGFALAAIPAARRDVPWHRVVNAAGKISRRSDGRPSAAQAARLRAEGVGVDARGKIAEFRARLFSFDARRRRPAQAVTASPITAS